MTMDKTTFLLEKSIEFEEKKKLEGLGHQFRSKERKYHAMVDKLYDVLLELHLGDPFDKSVADDVVKLVEKLETMALGLRDEYEDRD
jgi:hypothetical protein